jgi:hypothetical protein
VRKAFLAPPVVLALCVGLYGCGGSDLARKAKTEKDEAEAEVAGTEKTFQSSASSDQHRARARRAVMEFIAARCGAGCKVHGLQSVPSEGGTYRIAADVEIGQKREILRFEAIRFFAEKTELKERDKKRSEEEEDEKEEQHDWHVILLSATDKGTQGDPGVFDRLKTSDAPKAEQTPAAPVAAEPTPAAPAAEPTPGASAPP